MDQLFGRKYTGESLTIFSSAHIAAILFLIISNFLILYLFKTQGSKRWNTRFRYIAAALMLFHSFSFTLWSIRVGYFSVKDSLPLHLCDVSVLLSALMLITKSRFFFEVTYFWGLGGAFLAILTPDIYQSFPHFVFINYFLSHGGIITCVLWMVIIERYVIRLRSVTKVFITTNVYMLLIAGVNLLLKSNYLYICHKPYNPSLIDFLGPWPWYVVSLEGVSLVIFLLLYLPFTAKRKQSTHFPLGF